MGRGETRRKPARLEVRNAGEKGRLKGEAGRNPNRKHIKVMTGVVKDVLRKKGSFDGLLGDRET